MAQRHFFMTLKGEMLAIGSFYRHKKMTLPSLFYDAQKSLAEITFLQLTFTFWGQK
jgi:hypothetical protein